MKLDSSAIILQTVTVGSGPLYPTVDGTTSGCPTRAPFRCPPSEPRLARSANESSKPGPNNKIDVSCTAPNSNGTVIVNNAVVNVTGP